jgi:acyl-CoA thioester hydrolase
VIDLRLRYAGPARFGQRITITARLREWENRLKLDYVIRDAESGKRLTRGYSVQVAVGLEDGEMLLASPRILIDRLMNWQTIQLSEEQSTEMSEAPLSKVPPEKNANGHTGVSHS